jgi:hypothetical protein
LEIRVAASRLTGNFWTIEHFAWAAEQRLGGRSLRNNEEVQIAVRERLRMQVARFLATEFLNSCQAWKNEYTCLGII